MSTPEQRAEWAAVWTAQCGPCDAGLPMGCACPTGDPRPVISALLADVERLGRHLADWKAECLRWRDDAEEMERLRAENRRLREADR